jgi:4-amino-4-deoxy-L-arabinose transferase-like glycosyltransferase
MTARAWYFQRHDNPAFLFALCFVAIASLAVLRGIFAATIDLRVDEAYYWTWSKENVISYLDHPPMIAWCIRLGTFLFGDTNFGVRFTGLLAMVLMQLLLADIVWRTLRDFRYVAIAILLPDATLAYGMMMAKATPDAAQIAFALAMVWSLVRLTLSDNPRWWLLAGMFGGLALLSKYTTVLLLPAILAYLLVPPGRMKQLSSPYPWLAGLIAIVLFAPVLYWNAVHDWASFKFQLDRPAQIEGWSARFLVEFVALQLALIGPLLPAVVIGADMLAWRGWRSRDPISVLLSTCVVFPLAYFVWRAHDMRIGDNWPLFVWPFAFAAAVINLQQWRRDSPAAPLARRAPAILAATTVAGYALVAAALIYYLAGSANYLIDIDPIGKEAGFSRVVEVAEKTRQKVGATWFATTDYRIYSMLRWHLKDRVPVVQINERNRYLDFKAAKPVPGAIGLYVMPEDFGHRPLWQQTGALRTPVASVDLDWRGVVYDIYSLQTLTGWTPVLSPPPGDAFYVGSPH